MDTSLTGKALCNRPASYSESDEWNLCITLQKSALRANQLKKTTLLVFFLSSRTNTYLKSPLSDTFFFLLLLPAPFSFFIFFSLFLFFSFCWALVLIWVYFYTDLLHTLASQCPACARYWQPSSIMYWVYMCMYISTSVGVWHKECKRSVGWLLLLTITNFL